MTRRVISLWLPRFATDRITRSARRAEPAEKPRRGTPPSPLVTVQEREGKLLLIGVNRAGLAAGLYPGQVLGDARAILPSVRTAPADPDAEAAALERLAGWCARYSPWTAVYDFGERDDGSGSIWLDVSGCAHLFGGEAALLKDLTGRLRANGFEARAGLADTPGAAWAVCRYGIAEKSRTPFAIVVEGNARTILAPLPAAALRLPGETVAALDALGLKTVAHLLDLPRESLAARFGARIANRLDAALGITGEAISPTAPPERFFAHRSFAEPIGKTDDIAAALENLLRRLASDLALAHRGARRLVLGLYEPNGAAQRFAIGTGRPSRAPTHLARLFATPLETLEIEFGIEAMTLTAPVTEPLGAAQAGLAEKDGHDDGDADALVDRLANRLGPARILRFAPRESHVPERAVIAVSALTDQAKTEAAWPTPPRPIRLLPRPEPIEAMAPVPDDPPVMIRWRRVARRIVRAEGPERINPEWWRDPDGEDGRALRDYYRIEDENGRRYWVYREGLYRADGSAQWFLHGLFS